MSANEEFHSANEELETSREELQSVNEELETVNAELRRKVEALDRANSDLQNLLDSTQIATLFLDTALHITQFTPAIGAVVPLRTSDRGRPLADLAPRFVDVDLVREAEDVLRTLAWRERSLRTRDGDRRYLDRQAGLQSDVTGAVDGVGRRLQRVPEHRMADVTGRDTRALERVPRGYRSQLGGREVFQRAAERPETGPHPGEEDDVCGGSLGLHGGSSARPLRERNIPRRRPAVSSLRPRHPGS